MTDAIVHDLAMLLGPKGMVSESDMLAFVSHYRGGVGRTPAVAQPRTLEEIRAVVRYCYANDIRLVAQGANTGLVGASAPDTSGGQVLLSLDRMNRIRSVSPEDRLAVVEAGVRLSALNSLCEPENLFCPIDLAADPTLGGMAATNTGGARLIRYGGMREQILGLEYVMMDADATIGGRLDGLRKNNCGPSIDQLLIGSGGELAIITAMAVTLNHCPAKRVCALIELNCETIVPSLILRMEHALGDTLTACEGMSRDAMSAALGHGPALNLPFPPNGVPVYALLIEASTSRGDFDFQERTTDRLAGALEACFGAGITNVSVGDGAAFWALRHRISDALRDEGQVIGHDVSMSRSRLPEFHEVMRAKLDSEWSFLRVCDFGHVADGGDHYNLVWPHSKGPDGDRTEVINAIRECVYNTVVNDFQGSFSAEHGLGPLNASAYQRLVPASQRRVLGDLKQLFDPKSLLGHGVLNSRL